MTKVATTEKLEDYAGQTLFWSLSVSGFTTLLYLLLHFSGGFSPHSAGALFLALMILFTVAMETIAGIAAFVLSLILLIRFKTFSFHGWLAATIAIALWSFCALLTL